MNSNTPNASDQPSSTIILIDKRGGNTLGIASFVLGLISIFMLAPIFVPIALILGTIGVIKKQLIWSIFGIIFAIIGFVTSPILLGIFGLLTLGSMLDNPRSITRSVVPRSNIIDPTPKIINPTGPTSKRITGVILTPRDTVFRNEYPESPMSMPQGGTITSSTSIPGLPSTVTEESVRKGIIDFYNRQGEWAGQYVIDRIDKLRVEAQTEGTSQIHVRYRYESALGNSASSGFDQRIFVLSKYGDSYAITKMLGHMSARF